MTRLVTGPVPRPEIFRFAAVVLALAVSRAGADPLRLRADALATTQSPAGLVMLEADAKASATVNAEAVLWTAASPLPGQEAGDVLVMALRARTADGRASGRIGRFVATLGALRPVHIDGAAGRVRLPHRFDVEAYAGIPVMPNLAADRSWDWAAGGRISRRLGDFGSVGVAMLEQRDAGKLATREVGADAGFAIDKKDDVGARFAYDLANPGIADVGGSVIRRDGKLRGELYGGYRAASHLLPATSLFTVLGDTPSSRAGVMVSGRVAPRLEIGGDMGLRAAAKSAVMGENIGGELAPALALRARLGLDDRFASALSGELRRDGLGDDQWSGARAAARIGLPYSLTAATELEIVVPDVDRGRGKVWPWALAALAWDRGPWHAAAAVEASASAEYRHRVDALFTLGRQWGVP